VNRPFRAPCLVHFLVAAPYRIAAHAAPPSPPLVPARRRVAAREPTAPCAVPRAFPRRRAMSHRRSRYPSSASPRPRSAPRRSMSVDRAARCASCISSSPRHIASPLTLPLLRLPSPPLGTASQRVGRPRRVPCLVRFLVAAPYRIAAHAAPPPPPLAPARRRVAARESPAPRAVPRAFPRRRAMSHRRSRCPSSASPYRTSPPLGVASQDVSRLLSVVSIAIARSPSRSSPTISIKPATSFCLARRPPRVLLRVSSQVFMNLYGHGM
jgi:hypothetical protein